VGALADTVSQALARAAEDCVVSDVGSTKLALDDARRDPRFFGGHPIAGAETTGVAHAREDMFEGASWYLTADFPTKNPDLLGRLLDLIRRLGAHPRMVSAAAHDRLMACTSHLPHVFANALAVQALAAYEREGSKPIAGPSLRDAIRVAGANTAVWTDIYLANGPALIVAIDEVIDRLTEAKGLLAAKDPKALEGWNERARAARQALLEGESPDPLADA
jgi:prephenate dehydrogenase